MVSKRVKESHGARFTDYTLTDAEMCEALRKYLEGLGEHVPDGAYGASGAGLRIVEGLDGYVGAVCPGDDAALRDFVRATTLHPPSLDPTLQWADSYG